MSAVKRVNAGRLVRIVRVSVALAIRLATVGPAHAASADSVDVARVEQQLQEAQYARIGIQGRTLVLIQPRAVPGGLGYERIEKVPRRRYEILEEAGSDSVPRPLNPIPWSRIDQIESGTRPRLPSALVGGTIGLATGIAVGAGLSLFGIHMSGGGWDDEASRFTLATGGIFGVVGAGIGALLPATKWKPVYPEPKESTQR